MQQPRRGARQRGEAARCCWERRVTPTEVAPQLLGSARPPPAQPDRHGTDGRAARIGRGRGLDRRRGREELAGGQLEPREDDGLRGCVPDECGANTRTQAREQGRHGSRLVAGDASDGDRPSGRTAASRCVHVLWLRRQVWLVFVSAERSRVDWLKSSRSCSVSTRRARVAKFDAGEEKMSRNNTATIYGNLRQQIIPIATSEQAPLPRGVCLCLEAPSIKYNL